MRHKSYTNSQTAQLCVKYSHKKWHFPLSMLERSTFYPQKKEILLQFPELGRLCTPVPGLLGPIFPDTIKQDDFQFILPLHLSLPYEVRIITISL